MSAELGVLFAIGALLCWGFGDFSIQRATRKIGDWEALFVIVALGAVVLTPLVYKDLEILFSFQDSTFLVLTGVSVVLLMAALFDFEALKKGKITIAEPLLALEVPITAVLAVFIINEGLGIVEIFLITILIAGLILISLRSHHLKRKVWLEKGVVLMICGAVLMGIANFMYGFATRITNPLLTNWFIDVFVTLICLFYLMSNKRTGNLTRDIMKNKKIVFFTAAFDNLAWIFFAFAVTFIPITIALSISESYIAVAALLGLAINKEILMRHQKIGLATALGSAVALSVMVI
ncbi:MAG: DMT family transporter [Candidatus Aenigmarchaeota archaeon]|nr:DMT family transporter [Candidatus Aenigmarchaeota archaeon]